ncbi:electron transport complex subunit RsxC [Caproiciproducens galactitolivorans]|uniref:Ion-translocating oxidoreductase complex subunit C n=1 Tax=Caproiciproducens galactitolivorans TaxID=642589 RepID=A0ABT4BPU3_9FIRM|nr:electron transport complex subunit RsxC [Caproiciproducens galactitolivorans]MCY1712911.1 electron transport complex subunit RsxC [Caproiciproducens galactitolivorans]
MEFPVKPFLTHGGADVPPRKSTEQIESAILPPPAQVVLPMQQHAGAPCAPLVKVGDEVLVGQKIADSDAFISAPIHASISGKVTAIKKVMLPGGQFSDAVVIDSDGEMKISPDLKPPVLETPSDLAKAARESGLVGLGGAGFPTHVKLSVQKDKPIDTLIVNAAECEPYITADDREIIENTQSIFDGISVVRRMLKIERVILAVEENKPDGIRKLKAIADGETNAESRICILTLPSRYPQGAEKVLIKACTNREIPIGKLPADVGCLVMNVTSVAFLANYLKTGMPLVKKRVTIDGSAIRNPQNVIVPVGTKIADVVDFCGGYRAEPKKLLMGGPMMGLSLADDSLPILKQNNGILAFDEQEARMNKPTSCIRCGRCVNSCPMNLIPTQLEKYSNAKDIEKLQEYDVMDCMECGSCAFNCPAGRPLVQAIRLGKGLVKAGGKK